MQLVNREVRIYWKESFARASLISRHFGGNFNFNFAMQRPLGSFPLPAGLLGRLKSSGFEVAEDLKDLGVVELSKGNECMKEKR